MKNENEDIRLTPEESWPKMEQQLDRYYANKRKQRAAWFLLSVALVGTLIGYWFANDASETVQIERTATLIPESDQPSEVPVSSQGPVAPASTSNQPVAPIASERREPKKSAVQAESGNLAARPKDRNIGIASDRTTSAKRSTPVTQIVSVSHQITAAPSQPMAEINYQAANDDIHATTASDQPATDRPAAGTVSGGEPKQDAADLPIRTAEIKPDKELITGSSTDIVADESAPASNIESPDDPQPVDPVVLPVAASEPVAVPTATGKDTAHKHSVSKTSGSIEFAYGRYVRSRTLSSTNADWDQRRTDEEEIRIPQSFSILYSRQYSNWSFGVGVEYWKLGEATYYSGRIGFDSIVDNSYYTYQVDSLDTLYLSGNQFILRDNSPNVLDSTYNLLMDTVDGTRVDQSLVTRNGIVSWSLVQFPVRFGYSAGNGKLSVSGQVAIAPGILTGVSGDYLDVSRTRLVAADQLGTVRRFQLAASLGLRLEYRFSGNWSIMAGPDWRRQFTSMYRKDTGIDQRYDPWGLSAGVKCRLGHR